MNDKKTALERLQAWAEETGVPLELHEQGIRLYAAPLDNEAEFHLSWDGVDWRLVDGPVPMPPSPRHWWRMVRIMCRRFGVALSITPPQEALVRWKEGMSSCWYVWHHVLEDLGMVFETSPIPTLDEFVEARRRCDHHHEPIREETGCVVEGCQEGT